MKLCPICDHELNAANMCPVCKKVVRKPWIVSDGIYLNKSHYKLELNCEFHGKDRKKTYLNQRHDRNETDCSYHKADSSKTNKQKKLRSQEKT